MTKMREAMVHDCQNESALILPKTLRHWVFLRNFALSAIIEYLIDSLLFQHKGLKLTA